MLHLKSTAKDVTFVTFWFATTRHARNTNETR